jgi:hypothetical protein
MYAKRYSEENKRKRESLDLSEYIYNSRTETVVITAVEKKDGKHHQYSLLTGSLGFFISHPSRLLLTLHSHLVRHCVFISFFWCVVHLLNIPVSRAIPSSLVFDNLNFNHSIV